MDVADDACILRASQPSQNHTYYFTSLFYTHDSIGNYKGRLSSLYVTGSGKSCHLRTHKDKYLEIRNLIIQ